jgi:anhydro-N-acetylmuramic acid kinase
MRVIGLMSGTSLDGIDAAVVSLDGGPDDLEWRLEAFASIPYTPERRQRIHDSILAGGAPGLCGLHADLGEWLAEAARAVCADRGLSLCAIDLIGSHGQTVWHEPPAAGRRGSTLQLGCPATIAERTGVPVVSDFRTRDMAAGGEGAPLVPFADRMLFARTDGGRILQNIGGIANLTRVPPRGMHDTLLAFDTGPGNALMDAAVERATDGAETFDRDGVRARSGRVREGWLAELLDHAYFDREPPKSTGRELFGRPFVDDLVARWGVVSQSDWSDLIATLTALSADTIAGAVRRWALTDDVREMVVTGGGARNPVLMGRITAALAPLPVVDGAAAGIDPDAKEAIAFAALAWAHVNRVPGNEPGATGAAGPRVLGSYTPA